MKKRLLSILLTACLLVGLLPTVALAATATNVSYLDASGKSQTCTSATEVTSSDTGWTTGWYVVQGTVEIGSRVTVSGDVHLILTDGCTLTVNGGIQVQDDDDDITNGSANALTIYAQSTDKSTMGKLIATGAKRDNNAVIGGNGGNSYGGSCGTIIINGGTVTATSTGYGAAIGGGYGIFTGGSGGTITINGGNINASNQIGAGIGGGEGGVDLAGHRLGAVVALIAPVGDDGLVVSFESRRALVDVLPFPEAVLEDAELLAPARFTLVGGPDDRRRIDLTSGNDTCGNRQCGECKSLD